MLVGLSGGPFTGIFALAWAFVIRHNQRTAMGRVDEVARVLLEPILSDS